jgi:hypothetical protein
MNHISFDHFSMVEIDYSEAISVNLQINHKKSSVQRKKPKMGKKQRIVMLSV